MVLTKSKLRLDHDEVGTMAKGIKQSLSACGVAFDQNRQDQLELLQQQVALSLRQNNRRKNNDQFKPTENDFKDGALILVRMVMPDQVEQARKQLYPQPQVA